MIDILSKRYFYFAISLLLIIPGMIILIASGLPLAIDFTGGSMLEVSFESGQAPPPAEVIQLYQDLGVEDVRVQPTEQSDLVIRSSFMEEDIRSQVV